MGSQARRPVIRLQIVRTLTAPLGDIPRLPVPAVDADALQSVQVCGDEAPAHLRRLEPIIRAVVAHPCIDPLDLLGYIQIDCPRVPQLFVAIAQQARTSRGTSHRANSLKRSLTGTTPDWNAYTSGQRAIQPPSSPASSSTTLTVGLSCHRPLSDMAESLRVTERSTLWVTRPRFFQQAPTSLCMTTTGPVSASLSAQTRIEQTCSCDAQRAERELSCFLRRRVCTEPSDRETGGQVTTGDVSPARRESGHMPGNSVSGRHRPRRRTEPQMKTFPGVATSSTVWAGW